MRLEAPRVSIVVTSYNHAPELRTAIDSALGQTHPCEVIVVEDGSSDGSADIVASYGGRIRAVYQENAGQPAAMNVGYAEASGDLVFFLDSDDVIYARAVEAVVGQITPSASTYMWYLDIIDGDGCKTGQRIPGRPPQAGDLRQLVLRRGPGARYCPPTSGMAWTRNFLERALPLPTTLRAWPDTFLTDAAPLYGDVVMIDRHLGAFRVHAGSTGQQTKALTVDNLDRVRLLNDVRLEYLSRHTGVNPATWMRLNWRQQAILALLGKLRSERQPRVVTMAAAGWASGGPVGRRVALATVAATIRLLPRRPALALARRIIRVEYM